MGAQASQGSALLGAASTSIEMARSRISLLSVVLAAVVAASLIAGVCTFVGPARQQQESDVGRNFFGGPEPAPAPAPAPFRAPAPERAEDSTLPQVLTVLFLISIFAAPSIYKL